MTYYRGKDIEKSRGNAIKVFVYSAKAGSTIGTNLTEDEAEEGFVPVWLSVDEAISILQDEDEHLASMNQEQRAIMVLLLPVEIYCCLRNISTI